MPGADEDYDDDAKTILTGAHVYNASIGVPAPAKRRKHFKPRAATEFTQDAEFASELESVDIPDYAPIRAGTKRKAPDETDDDNEDKGFPDMYGEFLALKKQEKSDTRALVACKEKLVKLAAAESILSNRL